MFGTFIGLFCFHRKQRDSEREKRMLYWKEQVCQVIVFRNRCAHGTTRMPFTKTSRTCVRQPDSPSFLSMKGVPGAQCTAVKTRSLFCKAARKRRLDCVITWPATTALTLMRAQWWCSRRRGCRVEIGSDVLDNFSGPLVDILYLDTFSASG